MKKAAWTIGSILLALIILVGGIFAYLRSTVSNYDGNLAVTGIGSPVTVVRDSYGIPHITTQSDRDAYYALGYCMAQDRLFQMETLRRAALGKLAEIFGKDYLATDVYFRTLFSACDKKKFLRNMDPETSALISAFADGVNGYIDTRRESLPVEFTILGFKPEKWTAEDVVSNALFTSFAYSKPFQDVLYATFIHEVGQNMADEAFPPDREAHQMIKDLTISSANLSDMITPPSDKLSSSKISVASGSEAACCYASDVGAALESIGLFTDMGCNNVGISGEKSGTGMPILIQDVHTAASIPSGFYEAHIITPTTSVSGLMTVGVPAFWGGQTDKIGWVFTAAFVDVFDLYVEKVNPANQLQVLYKGAYEDMKVVKEKVHVKGMPDTDLTIRITRHGPVVDELIPASSKIFLKPGTVLAVRWAGNETITAFDVLFNHVRKIQNTADAISNMRGWALPAAHLIVADKKGAIGYLLGGPVAIRNGFDGSLPVPGWTGDFEWLGYAAPAEKASITDMPWGFIASANARPPVPSDYPYYLGNYWVPPYRDTRVNEIIGGIIQTRGKFEIADANKLYADSYMLLARDYLPDILDALKTEKLTALEQKAIDELTRWDYRSTREAIPPTIFNNMVAIMLQNTFKPHLSKGTYDEYFKDYFNAFSSFRNIMADADSAWFDDPATAAKEQQRDMMVRSFHEAIAKIEAERGANLSDWAWGKSFNLVMQHPFSSKIPFFGLMADIGPLPMDGGFQVALATNPKIGDPYHPRSMTWARYIIDLADQRNSKMVLMTGISGNFMSPHYTDQIQPWYKFELLPLMLYEDQVKAAGKYHMVLNPR